MVRPRRLADGNHSWLTVDQSVPAGWTKWLFEDIKALIRDGCLRDPLHARSPELSADAGETFPCVFRFTVGIIVSSFFINHLTRPLPVW